MTDTTACLALTPNETEPAVEILPGRIPHLTREQLVLALKRVSGGALYPDDQLRTVCKQAWKMLKADGRAQEVNDA